MKNLAQAIPSNKRPNLKVAASNHRKVKPSTQGIESELRPTKQDKRPQMRVSVNRDQEHSARPPSSPTVTITKEQAKTVPTTPLGKEARSPTLIEGKRVQEIKADLRLDNLAKSTLKEWHPEEQPRERLMKYGPQALATSELIAILLRSGTKTATAVDVARNLLLDTNGHLRELASRDWRALEKVHGIGAVKAVTLVAALELGRRRGQESDIDRPTIRTAQAAFNILGPQLADLRHEECWVLLLNTACRLIGTERLSSGGVDGTVVDVRKLMAMALRYNATSFVLAHNHPSGNLTPSVSDISLTRNLVTAGKILNIQLLDHLIVAGHKFYSFSDENMLAD